MSGECTPDASTLAPSESAPDAIEPIRAWRVWRASTDDVTGHLTLHSLMESMDAVEARRNAGGALLSGAHVAPSAECTCGVYAHKTRKAAIKHAAQSVGPSWVRSSFGARWSNTSTATAPSTRGRARSGCRTSPTTRRCTSRALRHYGLPVGIYHTRTGRVLGTDDLHRAFVRESLRALPAQDRPVVPARRAVRVLAAFAVVVAAVLVFGFGAILVSLLAATALGNQARQHRRPSQDQRRRRAAGVHDRMHVARV